MSKRRFTETSGPSQRQLRVGELIRRTLSEILHRGEIYDPDIAHMSITVGEVRTSPDLKVATVSVMPLGGQGAREVIAALNRNKTEIRRHLNRNVDLKFSPELRFVADETFDRMDETRRLMAQDAVRRDVDAGDDGDDGDDD